MFTGFSAQDFSRLARCDRERAAVAAFRESVTALIQEFNRRPWARGMLWELERLALTPRAFFADCPCSANVDYIHGDAAHWGIFSWGGRWRPQFNLGMFGSGEPAQNYLRIGLGLNLGLTDYDSDWEVGREMSREFYRQFFRVLRSETEVAAALTRWLNETPGFFEQAGAGGPASVRPREFTEWLASSEPDDQEWVCFGRRLRPDVRADLVVLSDPGQLLSTMERVFDDLTPFWRRACFG
jgi:hypothetical protein